MQESTHLSDRYVFPWLPWLLVLIGLMALNVMTQPYEDSVSLVPPSGPYYLDPVWYCDDILGPSFFMLAGIMLLRQFKWQKQLWAIAGLGLSCIAFSLGDSVDVHWVFPVKMAASEQVISFSSWMSKVMVVITFCFFIVHSYDWLTRPAQKAAVFAFVLLYIDQIQMSISFDFAGYKFHVFEEILEVITGMFVCIGVARLKLKKTSVQATGS